MSEEISENKYGGELLVIPVKGTVCFPNALLTFEVTREKYVEALEEAIENESLIFLAAQKNQHKDEPELDDLFLFGTVSRAKQILRMPGNIARVFAEGVGRGIIKGLVCKKPFMKVHAAEVAATAPIASENEISALVRTAREAFGEFIETSGRFAPGAIQEVLSCDDPGVLSDLMCTVIGAGVFEKQRLLEETDAYKRLMDATVLVYREINILKVQKGIYDKVKSHIDKTQREYILREQIKVINEELGENDADEYTVYMKRINEAKLPDYARERTLHEAGRLKKMNAASPEASVIRDYLDLVLDLPWHRKTKELGSLQRAESILNKEHYGLEKVKERVIEFLAVRRYSAKAGGPIICLVGPPGVGKTSVAQSVARSLNRKYVRMSLGGVRDEAEIRGHRRTYIGAMPGRIISAMKQARVLNPLILLDEIDKLSHDFRGDPAAALLEALDAEQNQGFRDHYLDMPYDLSDVMFILTANTTDGIPPALLDRLEIIPVPSYTSEEKVQIALKYLIDKQLKKHGLQKSWCKIKEDAVREIISGYTREAGVRQLERRIGEICRKTVKQRLVWDNPKPVAVSADNLKDYLGSRTYSADKAAEKPEVGVARGLAWNAYGGGTLEIEVNVMKGSGKFDLTGNMGEVMKESAKAAISFIRANHEALHIHKNFYKDNDIHIHIPEGAVPKDGPSAGITMACAMVSALSGVPVKNDLGMTGEISIRGRVLPIGGLREKTMAAKNAGLARIILPFDNEKDLQELPGYLKQDMDFVLVKDMNEVLENALLS